MNRQKYGLLAIVGVIIFFVAIWGIMLSIKKPPMSPPQAVAEVDGGYRVIMGTFARVVGIAKDSATANACVEAAYKELVKVDSLMSDYKDNSELSKVNRDAFRKPVKVSLPTFEVLQKSVEFSKISNGAFDVTVGPLVDLWRHAGEANQLPSDAEIAKARSKVGYEKLILDVNNLSVKFTVDGMRIDLGAIAKGYAIDKAVEAMKNAGAIGGMVDGGGEIKCFGIPPHGKDFWQIGLQDPNDAASGVNSEPKTVLKIDNNSVSTSGDYHRFVTIQGKKYSHIIDRQTGKSSPKLSSVSIICPSATDADALSTIVSVMGMEDGLKLIESLPNTHAILISSAPEYEFYTSKDAQKFIIPQEEPQKPAEPNQKIAEKPVEKPAEKPAPKPNDKPMEKPGMYKTYRVIRTLDRPLLDGNWTGPSWSAVPTLDINNFMGDEPQHKPKTQAKLLYDDNFIYVIFRVEDKYVRAVERGYQSNVCRDSCVEFFFTPGEDISKGYFNIEINCGGTMLFSHQNAIDDPNRVVISDADCNEVKIFHSEPTIVEPEKQQPTVWVIEYRLPLDVIQKYAHYIPPQQGVKWRANFYKCADRTSHPHWLTWSTVPLPKPHFHQPKFFGTLIFE